ncbi:MAG: glycosyltransferase family 39 protein [Gemmatimonadota bacterium]
MAQRASRLPSDPAARRAPRWLIAVCLAAVLLGAALRFVNLGAKPYWYDETATSVRVSGYTWEEVDRALTDGPDLSALALQQFQRPGSSHGVWGTLRGLAVDEPQHPPLYYVLARVWVQAFGNDVATRRTLSALFSLLALPSLFWLCRELFADARAGWVAVALVALSPLHLVFAQEARATSLWTVGILLSSAALLRAVRLGTVRAWTLYAAMAVVALYTFLFSALVVIAHGVFVRLTEPPRATARKAWGRAAGIAALLAAPWYALVVLNQGKVRATTEWTRDGTSPGGFALSWLIALARPFLDVHQAEPAAGLDPAHGVAYGLIAILLVLGCAQLVRRAPRRVRVFILCLIGLCAVPLVGADVVLTGRLSTIQRLQFPTWLGLELVVAWWLAREIGRPEGPRLRGGAIAALLAILLAGAVSSIRYARAPTWWNKGGRTELQQAAAPHINRGSGAVVVLQDRFDALALSYRLDPDVIVRRMGSLDTLRPPPAGRALWLYAPSDLLRDRLADSRRMTPAPGVDELWRVVY